MARSSRAVSTTICCNSEACTPSSTPCRLRTMTTRSQSIQLRDPGLDDRAVRLYLLSRIAAGAEGVVNLLWRQLCQQLADPFGIFARDLFADPTQLLVLPGVVVMED